MVENAIPRSLDFVDMLPKNGTLMISVLALLGIGEGIVAEHHLKHPLIVEIVGVVPAAEGHPETKLQVGEEISLPDSAPLSPGGLLGLFEGVFYLVLEAFERVAVGGVLRIERYPVDLLLLLSLNLCASFAPDALELVGCERVRSAGCGGQPVGLLDDLTDGLVDAVSEPHLQEVEEGIKPRGLCHRPDVSLGGVIPRAIVGSEPPQFLF